MKGGKIMTLSETVVVKTDRLLYPVRIDYHLPLAKMIALGNYQLVDSDILPFNFPLTETGQMDANLAIFLFDRHISSIEVIAEMNREDYDPTRIEHLLAFGAKYPEIQRQFPISALGSIWQISINLSMTPTLRVSGDNWRSLKLDYSNYIWKEVRGFLAVERK